MRNLVLIIILVWLYLLSVLRRSKTPALYFIFGSIGMFVILLTISRPYWVWLFTHAIVEGVNNFSKLINICRVDSYTGLVEIFCNPAPITMSIDYEHSGIMETTAFISLVYFYPIFNRQEKLKWGLFGIVWLYFANIIRLVVVISLVYVFGNGSFYLANTFAGRMVFYVLLVILYYQAFTYSAVNYRRSL